jgi:hypothetical protein
MNKLFKKYDSILVDRERLDDNEVKQWFNFIREALEANNVVNDELNAILSEQLWHYGVGDGEVYTNGDFWITQDTRIVGFHCGMFIVRTISEKGEYECFIPFKAMSANMLINVIASLRRPSLLIKESYKS